MRHLLLALPDYDYLYQAHIGQIHKLSNRYLFNYANEIAYREDMRKEDNGKIFNDILSKCLHTPTHRDWCGYWQGNHKQDEVLYT